MSRRLLIVLVVVVLGYLGWNWVNQREYVMYALDVNTGAVLWSAGLPENKLSTSEPFMAEGKVYVGLVTQVEAYPKDPLISLVALDAATGARLWTYTPDPEQFPSTPDWIWSQVTPYASNGLVFMQLPLVESTSYQTLAIDAQTGALRWTLPNSMFLNGPRMYPEIRGIGDRLFALVYDEQNAAEDATDVAIKIIDPATGNVVGDLWRLATSDDESFYDFDAPFLQVNSDTVFLATTKGVHAFDQLTGSEKYLIEGENIRYSPLKDMLIVRKLSDVAAYDVHTGEEVWRYDPPYQKRIRGYFKSLRADESTITVMCDCAADDGDRDTTLFVLDTKTGQELWSQYIGGSTGSYFLNAVSSGNQVITGLTHYANGDEINGVAAFDAASGSLRWEFVTAPTRLKAPVTDGQRVYVTSWEGKLRQWLTKVDPSWRYRIGLSEN
ncbi:MAG: PQQ-binding-like beta-propeller repeat protein [Anaerolineae bacterium]|nr:PQQ-binding-like beta-propeller repeat protein [Anaerolineae bacterium]